MTKRGAYRNPSLLTFRYTFSQAFDVVTELLNLKIFDKVCIQTKEVHQRVEILSDFVFSYTVTVMQINYVTIIMWDVFHKDSCVYTRHVKTQKPRLVNKHTVAKYYLQSKKRKDWSESENLKPWNGSLCFYLKTCSVLIAMNY